MARSIRSVNRFQSALAKFHRGLGTDCTIGIRMPMRCTIGRCWLLGNGGSTARNLEWVALRITADEAEVRVVASAVGTGEESALILGVEYKM